MIQLAFHEDSLAAVDLRGGEKLPAGVSVDAQEVRYLVWSAQGRSHQADEQTRMQAKGERRQLRDAAQFASKFAKARSANAQGLTFQGDVSMVGVCETRTATASVWTSTGRIRALPPTPTLGD